MSDKQASTKNVPDAGGKPAAMAVPAVPADRILTALNHATAVVNTTVSDVRKDLEKFLETLTPKPPRPLPDDPCPSGNIAIAPFCHQKKFDDDKAWVSYLNARSGAVADLESELNNWSQAKSQHELDLGSADLALKTAVKAAVDAYNQKINPDSGSRSGYLFYTMKAAIAAAIQGYETSAASAGAALASAAGALLAAYATFLGAIGSAQANLLSDKAIAEQTLWHGVEQTLDAV